MTGVTCTEDRVVVIFNEKTGRRWMLTPDQADAARKKIVDDADMNRLAGAPASEIISFDIECNGGEWCSWTGDRASASQMASDLNAVIKVVRFGQAIEKVMGK